MRQVEPYRLWIGHAGDGGDFARVYETGIRAVVQLAAEEPVIPPPRDMISATVISGPVLEARL